MVHVEGRRHLRRGNLFDRIATICWSPTKLSIRLCHSAWIACRYHSPRHPRMKSPIPLAAAYSSSCLLCCQLTCQISTSQAKFVQPAQPTCFFHRHRHNNLARTVRAGASASGSSSSVSTPLRCLCTCAESINRIEIDRQKGSCRAY